MRCALLVLLLVTTTAVAKPRPWPVAGKCLPHSTGGGCVQISREDTVAIQTAVIDYLSTQQPDRYKRARAMIRRTVTPFYIGSFQISAGRFRGFSGDVVRLGGIDRPSLQRVNLIAITVGRSAPGAWRVLDYRIERKQLRIMQPRLIGQADGARATR